MANSRVLWLGPEDPPDTFPPLTSALKEPDGLLAAGGDLSAERLLYAYRSGIFPWYEEGQPLLWWSPDPRCVFLPGDHHVSRRLRRSLRQSTAELRFNTAFSEVISACAGPRRSEQGTWITAEMISAYENLRTLGWAHSVELWDAGELLGGLYGLAIGRAFFGESMFSAGADASKIVLLQLATMLDTGAFDLVDCQVVSSHLLRQGARVMPRDKFLRSLAAACQDPVRFENWPTGPISCSRLCPE